MDRQWFRFEKQARGGDYDIYTIQRFNGGLYNRGEPIALKQKELESLKTVYQMDWSHIDPSIFGTLFEQGLDPRRRKELEAHYTDPDMILSIIQPVLEAPLLREWALVKEEIQFCRKKDGTWKQGKEKKAISSLIGFQQRLADYRVLDLACGSGNFLYLALKTLKDLEHTVKLEADDLGIPYDLIYVTGPQNVLGLEKSLHASELAKVSVWIGDIQWQHKKGLNIKTDPVLEPLDHILCCDALLDGEDKTPWPKADVIIGNPPFKGRAVQLGDLGKPYCNKLRKKYQKGMPKSVDLFCYWFRRAYEQMQAGNVERVGLVANHNIRSGDNRKVLDDIIQAFTLFYALSDQPWVCDSTNQRVCIVCFEHQPTSQKQLDQRRVSFIRSNLTAGNKQQKVREAGILPANKDIAFIGIKACGPFPITREHAVQWLTLPANPNRCSNHRVIRPMYKGEDIDRPRENWIIDFTNLTKAEAALFEAPFEYARQHIRAYRRGRIKDKKLRERHHRIRSKP